MDWYIEVLKKYAVFNGRAGREEYWYFVLFNIIASVVLSIVDHFLGIALFGSLYALAVLLPGIGVSIRRLHDTNRSGWWLLIAFIPLIGAIVLLVFMVQEGTSDNNQFGANPVGRPA